MKRIITLLIVIVCTLIFITGCNYTNTVQNAADGNPEAPESNPNGGPVPGDIFREYKWTGPYVNASGWQRVTDSNATFPGSEAFLPNPVNKIEIDDLKDAVKAEICLEQWGGHPGTSDKKIRINGNQWIPIPVPSAIGAGNGRGESYQYMTYPNIPIPLEQLQTGANTFEFTSGPQISHNFNWGQWGFHGALVRIYYSDKKNHPSGVVTSPGKGGKLGEIAVLSASANSTGSEIRKVDFIGYYEDFDYNGDGEYQEWHYNYRHAKLKYHIGTAEKSPYQVTWDTSWIPDQQIPMRIMACITDSEGMSYMTKSVDNLSLSRNNVSVKMYKPYDVPKNWQSRDNRTHTCKVDIKDDLGKAVDAKMILTTWSGEHAEEIGLNMNKIVQHTGLAHEYSLNEIPVPINIIKNGQNVFYTKSSTKEHGIEVLWPGIVLKVKYK